MPLSITQALAIALVVAGMATLSASLLPLRRIIAELPAGRTLRVWRIQALLTVFFIGGYLAYAVVTWGRHNDLPSLIVPTIFFFGAGFVWQTFSLAHRTALDVRRIALLEQESITDHLTGVYNRRYLQRRLLEEFERARRYGQPLSVLLLDIDHFKRINDERGHPAGDLVLGHFGALCLNAVRSSDIVARYGGEELMVIAPHTSASEAVILAERLRKRVEETVLVAASAPNQRHELRFTVSIGVAALTAEHADCNALIDSADRGLYCAKQEGRNRTSMGSCVAARIPSDAAARPVPIATA